MVVVQPGEQINSLAEVCVGGIKKLFSNPFILRCLTFFVVYLGLFYEMDEKLQTVV